MTFVFHPQVYSQITLQIFNKDLSKRNWMEILKAGPRRKLPRFMEIYKKTISSILFNFRSILNMRIIQSQSG